MRELTEHFTDLEFGLAEIPDSDARMLYNAQHLCTAVLEPIRAKYGPVRIHDGYRPADHNQAVGGKPNSYHLYANGKAAADFDVVGHLCNDVFDWLRLESDLAFDKLIAETNPDGTLSTLHVQIDRFAPPRRLAYTGSTGDGVSYVQVEVR